MGKIHTDITTDKQIEEIKEKTGIHNTTEVIRIAIKAYINKLDE